MGKLSDMMTGFRWQFPGGAESSMRMVIRQINENPRMSKAQKREMIESVVYMAGHICSDVAGLINQEYSSAHSSGLKWMKWQFSDDEPGWFLKTFFAEPLRRLRMNQTLQDERLVHNVNRRIRDTLDQIEGN